MLLLILKALLLSPYLIIKYILDKRAMGVHLYGIYGFFGLAGKGKTIAMTHYLEEKRKEYGDKIYIATNYFYEGQDFPLNSWKDLLKDYDKPLLVAYDELPNEFNSREFKSFPIALMTLLTQVRKKNGIQLLYSAQRWHFVDKNFRSLSFGCYECGTILGNLSYYRYYDPIDYDNLCSQSDYDKRMKIHPKFTRSYLQTKKLRNSYDSYKMLESAKSKEYMDREEIYRLKGD